MFTKKDILEIIQDNIEEIRKYGVKKLGVFGSFARSFQNNKSDVDILVEFQKGKKTFDSYMELRFLLERLFHRKVDLVIKDALKPQIKQDVLKEVSYAGL